MNKTIIVLMFFCCSCKNNNNTDHADSAVVDTTMTDSSSILVGSSLSNSENSIDDSVDNQIQKMQENKLSYDEVIQSNSIDDLENFIKYNPEHEKIEQVKIKLIDLRTKQNNHNK